MGYNRRSFAVALLGQLGIDPNPRNVKALVGWARAEGGNWNNSARFNPLNTTLNLPGASSMNSVGVKAYNSWDQGLHATVATLKNGRYGGIIQALKSGRPQDVARAIDQSPWGTHGSLIYQAIAGTPAKPVTGAPRAPRGGGGSRTVTLSQALSPQQVTLNPPDSSPLMQLMSQQQQPQVPISLPTAPSGGAEKYLRGASAGQVPSVGAPAQQSGGLAEQLAQMTSQAPPLVSSVNVKGGVAKVVGKIAVPATGQQGNSPITAPGTAPDALRAFIERANQIDQKHLPYVWGGGHAKSGKADRGTGRDPGIGFDCSGAVSAVLGVDPRVSGQFAQWGQSGPGKHVTIYANGTHVLMRINGHFFGTSSTNPGGGAGWIPASVFSPSYLAKFTARHPRGL